MALAGCRPEILHSGQRCQFASTDFVAKPLAEKIRISWSGRKRCYDIIFRVQERCHPFHPYTRGLDGEDQCVVTARLSRLM